MYKVFFLFLCLLAFTPMVGAQDINPRRPAPSPPVQGVRLDTSALAKELLKSDRLRDFAREAIISKYFEQRARVQDAVPTSDQHPLTPPTATSVLGVGGFPNYMQDPNLLKYGPFGPDVKYGPMGPLAKEQGARQSANAQPNPGVVLNISDGFTPLDWLDKTIDGISNFEGLDQTVEDINRTLDGLDRTLEALNRDIEGLNHLQLQSAAATPGTRNTVGVTAQAAAHQKSSDIRSLDPAGLPESGRLIVRSNPKGYYVGSLDIDQNDQFRVKAKHFDTNDDGDPVCWALGDALLGTVKLDDVWVNCNGLKGNFSDVRQARDSEIPRSGKPSARHLEDRFASFIAPFTNPDKKGPKDAKEFAVLTQDTTLYGNYPLSQPANLDGSRSLPGPFSDDLGVVVHAGSCNDFFKVRYFSNDGNAAVGKYVHINSQTGDHVEVWGILPMANISLPLREGPPPCKQ